MDTVRTFLVMSKLLSEQDSRVHWHAPADIGYFSTDIRKATRYTEAEAKAEPLVEKGRSVPVPLVVAMQFQKTVMQVSSDQETVVAMLGRAAEYKYPQWGVKGA